MLDPRLKGKMTASMFLVPRFVGALGIAWGEDKALQYARDLREKTDILLTRAPRESLLQSGERVISVGEIDSQVRAWIAEGLPVAFVVPEPVIVGQFGASVMAKAPNPNAARLMAGCLASIDGKKAAREGDVPERLLARPPTTTLAKRLHSGSDAGGARHRADHGREGGALSEGGVDPDRPGEVTGSAAPMPECRHGDARRGPTADSLDLGAGSCCSPARGLAVYLILVPLGMLLFTAFRGPSTSCRSSPARAGRWRISARSIRRRALYRRILPDTLVFVAGTVALTFTIAFALAWLIERTDLPGREIWFAHHPVSAAGADPGARRSPGSS